MYSLDDKETHIFGTEGSGHQTKLWVKNNGDNYLIKLNSKYREATKEESVSKILRACGIECVDYRKGEFKFRGNKRTGCICKSYLKEGDISCSLATLMSDVNIKSNESAISFFNKSVECINEQLGIDRGIASKYLMTIVTIDYLVMNKDKHLNNIEFICRNGKWAGSPLFDFGQSFLCRDGAMTKEQFIKEERKFKTLPFSSNPEKNLINIEFAKSLCRYITDKCDIDELDINSWHKRVFKNRCERLLVL